MRSPFHSILNFSEHMPTLNSDCHVEWSVHLYCLRWCWSLNLYTTTCGFNSDTSQHASINTGIHFVTVECSEGQSFNEMCKRCYSTCSCCDSYLQHSSSHCYISMQLFSQLNVAEVISNWCPLYAIAMCSTVSHCTNPSRRLIVIFCISLSAFWSV